MPAFRHLPSKRESELVDAHFELAKLTTEAILNGWMTEVSLSDAAPWEAVVSTPVGEVTRWAESPAEALRWAMNGARAIVAGDDYDANDDGNRGTGVPDPDGTAAIADGRGADRESVGADDRRD